MSEPALEIAAVRTARRWIRGRLILTGFLVFMLVLFVIAISLTPPRLQPGEVVESFGTFSSPGGYVRVAISETPDGNVRIAPMQSTKRYFVATWHDSLLIEVEAERDWFVSFDDYDRFWQFVGTQETPFGTAPQWVILDGFWLTPSRPLFGSTVVSRTGHWEGVPGTFFDRIPGKREAVWEEDSVIPSTAPELSEPQRLMAASSMQNL